MAKLEMTEHRTPETVLALFTRADAAPSERPVVVMLHGAQRDAGVFADWFDWAGEAIDLMLIDLPGHGRSPPLIPASVEAFARNVLQAIRTSYPGRRVLLVGESLGGLVALAAAGLPDLGPLEAVLACDPPMSTAKLWNVIYKFRKDLGLAPDDQALASLALETFGIGPTTVTDRLYYPLLDALKVPAVIATGDVPLLPPRSLTGTACVFDAVDQYVVRRFYPDAVELVVVPDCDHLALANAPDRCREIVADILARHLAAPAEA